MKEAINIFKEYCKTKRMRYTPEREVIIEEIYRKDGHFDIDSLFLRIRTQYPDLKIAKGSIYRTLPHLIKADLIRESYMDGNCMYYEHVLGHKHHDHMKCLKCGKVFEFCNESIDKIQEDICKNQKFKLLGHVHVLFGHCEDCYE